MLVTLESEVIGLIRSWSVCIKYGWTSSRWPNVICIYMNVKEIFFFIFGCSCSMQKFPGQGLNCHHSCYQSHSSDKPGPAEPHGNSFSTFSILNISPVNILNGHFSLPIISITKLFPNLLLKYFCYIFFLSHSSQNLIQ